jgi:hypothetical protein
MPRPPDRKLLKCVYCDYTIPRFRRLKNGKLHHGHDTLQDHVFAAHYETYLPVLQRESDDWDADPLTLDGDGMEEHPFDYL